MAGGVTMQVDQREFRAYIGRLEKKSRNKALTKLLRDACKPMLSSMKVKIPRRSGLTAADLKIRALRLRGYVYGVSCGLSTTSRGRGYIGRFLEYGTAKYDPPASWFRSSVDAHQRQVEQAIDAGISKMLREAER